MKAADLAREILSICTGARLSADVITLLSEKTSLLAEKVEALELQVAHLKKENAQLQVERNQLRNQLQYPPPKPKLSDGEAKVLEALGRKYTGMTVEEIADHIDETETRTLHYCDRLIEGRYIARVRFRGQYRRFDGPDWGFELTPEGRKWLAGDQAKGSQMEGSI